MNPLEELLIKIDEANLWQEDLTLKRNAFLNQKGQINTDLFFVMAGSVRVFMLDEAEEHTIRFGYKNSVFTALDSFFTHKPSAYYIQAIKKTELKVVSQHDFINLVQSSPENQRLYNAMLSHLVVQQMEREVDLLTASPQERYQRVLKRSPQLFQEIPAKYIASYLRMTPETLSRVRKLD